MSSRTSLFTRMAALVALLHLALPVLAHIELKSPPGINSKFDPQTAEADKDYSMTSPLNADGSNYPCKGYNTAANYAKLNSVDTLVAGSDYTITLDGTATHNGGSCQFAISYDQGSTFAVIASIIGGCPIGLEFTIPIPEDLPSASKATFSWTWENFSGNREMYMNCAIVDISGSDATSYTGPSLFRANTFADGSCITTEGEEIVYPNPGPSVQYLGASTSSSAQTVLDNCDYDEDSDVTITSNGSAGSGSGSGSGSSSAATTTKKQSSKTSSTGTATATKTSTKAGSTKTASSVSSPVVNLASSSDIAASFAASSPLPSSSSKAAGATTTAAAPLTSWPSSSSSSSSSSSYIQCDSTTTFSLCGAGTCTAMGSVAAGTICTNGEIVVESRMKRRRSASGVARVNRRMLGGKHFGDRIGAGRWSKH
ncbi:hypothetical protein BCR35DRAFT_304434 [Leucosporidium creatinivorum]|uniref:Chitin-binding type-4 domain-containing protein n=1 Tax=Leucosporidium creatinivorum TaxID=106004 RepID=A0A1Y2FBK5_9BASI|nr:hypothetical protein BCR35DRAFT_304434 [Leucosporidium creatinivorum]